MEYLTLVTLFFGIFVLPIYLAIRDYRKREKKIAHIISTSSEIVSISKEIIRNLESETDNLREDRIIKEENTVSKYQEMNPINSPFLSEGELVRSPYTCFELNDRPSDPKKYVQLEVYDAAAGYNLVAL